MLQKKHEEKIIPAEILLSAYSAGYFPMADPEDSKIYWYSPDPRTIIPLDTFKISRSLHQVIKKNIFVIKINNAFSEVIRSCAGRKETWISDEIINSYINLHKMGFAHSIETWYEEKLVGGLYGVSLGAAFFGESMFSLMRDSSKVALAALIERLKKQCFELLDTQYSTSHLKSLGAVEIPKNDYLIKLNAALSRNIKFI